MFRYELQWTLTGKAPIKRIVSRERVLETLTSGPLRVKASKANKHLQVLENAAVLGDPAILEDDMGHGKREIIVWRIG